MSKPVQLLSETQMRDFIVNGYISLKPDLPESFHREVYETTEKAFERVGNPGNNILPMVPQLQQVFDHPQISGALTLTNLKAKTVIARLAILTGQGQITETG